jgi:hypothetical protein
MVSAMKPAVGDGMSCGGALVLAVGGGGVAYSSGLAASRLAVSVIVKFIPVSLPW